MPPTNDNFGKNNFAGPPPVYEGEYPFGPYFGGPPDYSLKEEELLPEQRIKSINFLPFSQRLLKLYEIGSDLIDYVIQVWHTKNIVFVEDQFDPEKQFHSNEFIFSYLGHPKFLELNFTDDQKKSLSLLISHLYNLKGTKRGLQLLLKLLDLDGEIYEWFEVNSGSATRPDGREIFFYKPISCGNVIIHFDIDYYPEFDFSDVDKISFLNDFMLSICTRIEEFRWTKTVKDNYRVDCSVNPDAFLTLNPGGGIFSWENWDVSGQYSSGDIIFSPVDSEHKGAPVVSLTNNGPELEYNPAFFELIENYKEWEIGGVYSEGDRVLIPIGYGGDLVMYEGRVIEAISVIPFDQEIVLGDDWRLVGDVEEIPVYACIAESFDLVSDYTEINSTFYDIWYPEFFGDYIPDYDGFHEYVVLGPTLGNIDTLNNTITISFPWKLGDVVHVDGDYSIVSGDLAPGVNYFIGVVDSETISLHETLNDAISGVSPVNLESEGADIQTLEIKQVSGLTFEYAPRFGLCFVSMNGGLNNERVGDFGNANYEDENYYFDNPDELNYFLYNSVPVEFSWTFGNDILCGRISDRESIKITNG